MNEDGGSTGVKTIVSGGQTGVDRAALDVAISLNIDHGGWCPKGRLAEDGVIANGYQLREMDSADYPLRTEQNVVDSDGTLLLHRGRMAGGTELTRRLALKHARPLLAVDLETGGDPAAVRCWLAEHAIQTLNVAGPRESTAPGIGEQSANFLRQVLSLQTETPAAEQADPKRGRIPS